MASNKRRRHTPDQIIRKLAEGNKLLGAGQELNEVCRHLEIAESTWHRWLAQYGGMKANEAKRLKELEAENARLKKLVANQALDIDMLKEIFGGKLLTPNRKRSAVQALRDRFGVSERRACTVVGLHRSTMRLTPPPITTEEAELRAWLRKFSTDRPRWGWRRAAKMARRAGWQVNNKRIRRLWREEGLRVPQRRKKKRLTGIGVAVGAMSPIRPNVIWAMDFQFDTTAEGRTLKMLNVIDEFTREALAIDVDRSIDADGVVDVLERLALTHGAPHYVRFDNGPEFVAHAVHDWCRFNSAGSLFIDPGSPWQNAWIESFNGRLRDELLNSWRFDSLLEARVIIEDWRCDYNANRPHSAHGELTPAEFALQWTTTHQPQVA
ncbi:MULTISPECIES: IS3 family transposase [Mycobacteriaceae]|uniref:IS3 family transposase n=1 Tax=Mycobacteriaceae TaxID=1762 RepID=UPI000C26495E|nr:MULTISPECIES: IS3 family transposase [Mycobacteriaceae]MDB2198003.1 IS3 family transposase [Mycobacteroides abscessus subsp. abscessus]MDB2203090.1 IS3 family transposase [Mycobacteroides abscessus subsp. abscessus]